MPDTNTSEPRFNWTHAEITDLFNLPFMDLMFRAQTVHRENFAPNEVQVSTLLSIKTGACPEDCKYCPQSGHYNTELEKEKLMEVQKVLEEAQLAKDKGASRFCMGAAWKHPSEKDFPYVLEMIKGVKALGLESCVTLGSLNDDQAKRLSDVGLDYYNHNLDTSAEFYDSIITTRTYQERLDTLSRVRNSGIKLCCGGIMGMGEEQKDRVGLIRQLSQMTPHPESVPINMLVKVEGTPMANVDDLDELEFIRTIAVSRIVMPKSHVRLSAGRQGMSEQTQALCFMAGANSIFYGEKLLTTGNPEADKDMNLFKKLGINPEKREAHSDEAMVGAIVDQVVKQEESKLFYDANA